MRNALTERPRVAVAKAAGFLALIACGVALGAFIANSGDRASPVTEARLATAERTISRQIELLSSIRSKLSRTQLKLDRMRAELAERSRDARAEKRTNARLRRDPLVAREARGAEQPR